MVLCYYSKTDFFNSVTERDMMKIAVTYDNGNVFQHFGRTESFKVYEIEDGKVVSSEVIGSDGIGHGALAGLLAGHDIQVLICGGLGGGALNALKNAGIEVCAGASGNADEAVEAFLRSAAEDTATAADAAADTSSSSRWKERTRERASGSTTEAPSTMERSLILPMTAARLWILSAAQA